MDLEQLAAELREQIAAAEQSANETTDPDLRQALTDTANELRGLARRLEERAALADDPDALAAWFESLPPERRAQLDARLRENEGPA